MLPKLFFCSDPLKQNQVDMMYQAEANAAQEAGFDYALINYETLVHNNDPFKAISLIPPHPTEIAGIYRGWMLTPTHYTQLYDALLAKGIKLINSPFAYKHCHYLPESYHVIQHKTPKTVWLPLTNGIDMDVIMTSLQPFKGMPVIVKDYVKSQKHYWTEACFIPNASDRIYLQNVVTQFVALQGGHLNGGLVFREYIQLTPLTRHSKSNMPLTKEFRVFVYNHQPLLVAEYWEEGNYGDILPDISLFMDTIRAVQSSFFTIDIVERVTGEWMIMELGDGQVAGLSEKVKPYRFYQKLVRLV